MKRGHFTAIGLGLLVSASAAFAVEPGSTSGTTSSAASGTTPSTMARDKAAFTAADTNHDGYISKTEAQQAGMADYSMADKNGDGRLDANEFAVANVDATRSSHGSSSTMSKPTQPSNSSSMSQQHY